MSNDENEFYRAPIDTQRSAKSDLFRALSALTADVARLPEVAVSGTKADLSEALESFSCEQVIQSFPKSSLAVALLAGVGVGSLLVPRASAPAPKTAGDAARTGASLGSSLWNRAQGLVSSLVTPPTPPAVEHHESRQEAVSSIAKQLAVTAITRMLTEYLRPTSPEPSRPSPRADTEATSGGAPKMQNGGGRFANGASSVRYGRGVSAGG